MRLYEHVAQARRSAGISQRSLAIRAGTSQAAISRIENGLEEPSFERFEAIMCGLGYAPRVALEPLATHDAEPRRLLEQMRKPAQARFEESINWSRFLRRMPSISPSDG